MSVKDPERAAVRARWHEHSRQRTRGRDVQRGAGRDLSVDQLIEVTQPEDRRHRATQLGTRVQPPADLDAAQDPHRSRAARRAHCGLGSRASRYATTLVRITSDVATATSSDRSASNRSTDASSPPGRRALTHEQSSNTGSGARRVSNGGANEVPLNTARQRSALPAHANGATSPSSSSRAAHNCSK